MTKYAHTVEDLPPSEHYAALVNDSITSTEDYGPPDTPTTTTHHYLTYIVLGDAKQAQLWVEDRERLASKYGRDQSYRIIKVTPVTVQKTVTLELK